VTSWLLTNLSHVAVMLQAMKEEPPLAAKCKDKFLIQSTFITPAKETMNLKEIVRDPFSSLDTISKTKTIVGCD
jgi:hypothetical protein